MRKVLNFFIVGFIFWILSVLCPSLVIVESFKTLLGITVLFYVVCTLIMFVLVFPFSDLMRTDFGSNHFILLFVMFALVLLATEAVVLFVLTLIFSGFRIFGPLGYIVLVLLLTLGTTNLKINRK